MGLIRGAFFTVVAIILFVSLLSMNTFWTISSSLEYDVLQPQLVPIITNFIMQQTELSQQLDDNLFIMQYYCLNNTEFVFSQEGMTLAIPCSTINEGAESIINYSILYLIEENYYKEYDCSFWECSMTPPFHIISEKAQNYWSEWFYVFLVLSIILTIVCGLLIENIDDYPFILGGLFIISSLIFAKIEWILSFMGDWEFIDLVSAFFTQAYTVFLIMFIIGIVLILIGVALKFLGLGQWLLKLVGSKKKS